MSTALDSLLQEAAGVAGGYLTGGIRVEVKTNYTPAVTVYSGSNAPAPGTTAAPSGNLFSRLLGLQAGVKVLDANGHELATYGGWPATSPWRVGLALAVVGALGIGLVKLIRAF